MIHLRTWIGWFTLIAFGIAGGSAFAQPDDLVQVPGREAVEEARGSFIFVFDPAQIDGADAVPGLAQRLTAQAGGVLRHVYTTAIWGFSATLPQPAAERLAEQNPNIQYVEPNGVVWAIAPAAPAEKPDSPPGQDKKKSDDDGSSEPAQVLPYGIARVGGPVDGSGLTAWVIDTGIDLDHPDLNVGSRGANFVLRGKKSEDDGHGHGTHVSGTIAALDNTIDVVGVAAGATVEPVRVLDNSGSGTVDGVVAGIDHAAANGSPGDCANLSLGASGHFQSLHDAVYSAAENQGLRFAIAAGNSSDDASFYEPAHVEHGNVFTASAIDSTDTFAGFSNWGNPPVDFAAPGVSVLSTKKGGGVTTLSGTSMAAPHVCGILLLQATPNTDGFALDDPDGTPDPIAAH